MSSDPSSAGEDTSIPNSPSSQDMKSYKEGIYRKNRFIPARMYANYFIGKERVF